MSGTPKRSSQRDTTSQDQNRDCSGSDATITDKRDRYGSDARITDTNTKGDPIAITSDVNTNNLQSHDSHLYTNMNYDDTVDVINES